MGAEQQTTKTNEEIMLNGITAVGFQVISHTVKVNICR